MRREELRLADDLRDELREGEEHRAERGLRVRGDIDVGVAEEQQAGVELVVALRDGDERRRGLHVQRLGGRVDEVHLEPD